MIDKTYNVGIYCRLSNDDERDGESVSIENQKLLLQNYVRQRGWNEVDVYIDDGYSGTNFNRPGVQRLIEDAKAKRINLILVKDLSRFGRNYIEFGQYTDYLFPSIGCRFIALNNGIDTQNQDGSTDVMCFLNLFNEFYSRDTSKKVKAVKKACAESGKFMGTYPAYGYKRDPADKHHLVIDEDTAPTVRRLFAMRASGMGFHAIAVALNEEGVQPPGVLYYQRKGQSDPRRVNHKWADTTVKSIIRNEVYIGNMVQGRSVKISYKSKKCLKQDPANWVVVEGTHEPLVDVETFRKVRMLVNSRRHTRSRTYDFLLKGLIFCHECGYPLAVLNRKNARGEDELYFVCRTYQRFTKAGVCTCHSIKEKTVTDAVVAKVREVCQAYLNPDELLPVAREAVENAGKQSGLEMELQMLQSKIDSLTANLDRVYTDRLSGLLPESDFQRIFSRIKLEREQLEEKRQELELRQKSPVRSEDRARELVQRFVETAGESRELLVSLIEWVELTEDKKVIIKFRFAQLDEASQNSQGVAPFETA